MNPVEERKKKLFFPVKFSRHLKFWSSTWEIFVDFFFFFVSEKMACGLEKEELTNPLDSNPQQTLQKGV